MNEDTRLRDLCAELPEWIRARVKAAYWYGASDGLQTFAPLSTTTGFCRPTMPVPSPRSPDEEVGVAVPAPGKVVGSCLHPYSVTINGAQSCLSCGALMSERAE